MYCPSHHPRAPSPPSPCPPCNQCHSLLVPGVEWMGCPSCSLALHTSCLAQTRPSSCSYCGDVLEFCRASNNVGVRVKDDSEEDKFASTALSTPSATISYLSKELTTENSPALISSKMSPVNAFLSQQRTARINMTLNSPLPKTRPTSPLRNTPQSTRIKGKLAGQPSPKKVLVKLLTKDRSGSQITFL